MYPMWAAGSHLTHQSGGQRPAHHLAVALDLRVWLSADVQAITARAVRRYDDGGSWQPARANPAGAGCPAAPCAATRPRVLSEH